MKKNGKRELKDCLEHTASANEFTGALQSIAPTKEEIEKFHKEYNQKPHGKV